MYAYTIILAPFFFCKLTYPSVVKIIFPILKGSDDLAVCWIWLWFFQEVHQYFFFTTLANTVIDIDILFIFFSILAINIENHCPFIQYYIILTLNITETLCRYNYNQTRVENSAPGLEVKSTLTQFGLSTYFLPLPTLGCQRCSKIIWNKRFHIIKCSQIT